MYQVCLESVWTAGLWNPFWKNKKKGLVLPPIEYRKGRCPAMLDVKCCQLKVTNIFLHMTFNRFLLKMTLLRLLCNLLAINWFTLTIICSKIRQRNFRMTTKSQSRRHLQMDFFSSAFYSIYSYAIVNNTLYRYFTWITHLISLSAW